MAAPETKLPKEKEKPKERLVNAKDILLFPTTAVRELEYPLSDDSTDDELEIDNEFTPDLITIDEILRKHGIRPDGSLLSADNIFPTVDKAAAFSILQDNGDSACAELPCVVLWDWFGGLSCLETNVIARDEVSMIGTEYPVCDLSPCTEEGLQTGLNSSKPSEKTWMQRLKTWCANEKLPKSTSQYLRGDDEWALVRVETKRAGREVIGLIPRTFIVEKSIYQAHRNLFDDPAWYIGEQNLKVASEYLFNPQHPQPRREGSFVIFSPLSLNLDPTSPRCYLMLVLLSKSLEEKKKIVQSMKNIVKKKKAQQRKSTEKPKISVPINNNNNNPTSLALIYMKSPVIEKVFPISRDATGAYIFLGKRFVSLYDIVWFGCSNEEMPFKLIYDALDPSLRPLGPIPSIEAPPTPIRDPHRLPMKIEQIAAAMNCRNTTGDALGYTSKTELSLDEPAHSALFMGGYVADNVETKLHLKKAKVSKRSTTEKKEKERHVDVRIKMHANLFVEDNHLKVDKKKALGKGEFGVVYAGKLVVRPSLERISGDDTMEHGGSGAVGKSGKKKPGKEETVPLIPKPFELESKQFEENRTTVEVAVKCIPRKIKDRASWMNEVAALHEAFHPNVVRFYGCSITFEIHKVALITELVKGGSLDKLLQKVTKETPVTHNDCASLLGQISRGMSYLHSLEPSIVHGDLAARNILLTPHPIDATRIIAKVTDFGLSKMLWPSQCVTYDDQKKLPIAWEPPEVHRGRELSLQTDVWMFGVLGIEFFVSANGGTPFGPNSTKIPYMFKDGFRHERMHDCPDFVWSAICKCWEYDPSLRITFRELASYFPRFYLEGEKEHLRAIYRRYYE